MCREIDIATTGEGSRGVLQELYCIRLAKAVEPLTQLLFRIILQR
jgi:hypothetical protein